MKNDPLYIQIMDFICDKLITNTHVTTEISVKKWAENSGLNVHVCEKAFNELVSRNVFCINESNYCLTPDAVFNAKLYRKEKLLSSDLKELLEYAKKLEVTEEELIKTYKQIV
ncbi:MAG: hypothetical protein U0V72_05905 [Cytophagales bacterium]